MVTGRGAVVVESAAALAIASAVTIRRIILCSDAASAQAGSSRCAASTSRETRRRNGAKAMPSVREVLLAVLARLVATAATSRRGPTAEPASSQIAAGQAPNAAGRQPDCASIRRPAAASWACLKRQRASRWGSRQTPGFGRQAIGRGRSRRCRRRTDRAWASPFAGAPTACPSSPSRTHHPRKHRHHL